MEAKEHSRSSQGGLMMQDNRRRGCVAEFTGPKVPRCPISTGRSYPKMIKNVRSSYNQLFEARSAEEMGRVARPLNKEKTEEVIRAELAKSTGQSLGRINKFLAQAEYLTEECLMKLDQAGADEDFFDAAQPAKRLLVKDLMSRGLTQKEIEKEISSAMDQMFQEYEREGKIDRKRWLDRLNGTSKEKPAWAPGRRVFGKPKVLIYRRPNGHSPDLTPPTAEEIADRLKDLAQELMHIAERPYGNDQHLHQEIGRLVIKMAKLHQRVRCLRESRMERVEHGSLH
jgi:hypothetical protein